MIAAVTLLPGLLGTDGNQDRQLRSTARDTTRSPRTRPSPAGGPTTSATTPSATQFVSFATLCTIAVPALHMHIGVPDDGNAGAGKTQRIAYDTLADAFGRGFNGPIQVVVDIPTAAERTRRRTSARRDVQADPGVATVTAPVFNPAHNTAVMTVNPTTGPQDNKTNKLVRHLHVDVLPATVAGTNAKVMLTGQAMAVDLTSPTQTSRLPLFIVAVVAMSFILLMVMFRSILVPFKAAVMNLLSIAAAYGVLVAMFQWGWARASSASSTPSRSTRSSRS